MSVQVYSGSVMIEEVFCLTEEQLMKVASYWSDEGFKIRIIE